MNYEEQEKKIYGMKLHDKVRVSENPLISVLKVPGGWVYTIIAQDFELRQNVGSSVFVPYEK